MSKPCHARPLNRFPVGRSDGLGRQRLVRFEVERDEQLGVLGRERVRFVGSSSHAPPAAQQADQTVTDPRLPLVASFAAPRPDIGPAAGLDAPGPATILGRVPLVREREEVGQQHPGESDVWAALRIDFDDDLGQSATATLDVEGFGGREHRLGFGREPVRLLGRRLGAGSPEEHRGDRRQRARLAGFHEGPVVHPAVLVRDPDSNDLADDSSVRVWISNPSLVRGH